MSGKVPPEWALPRACDAVGELRRELGLAHLVRMQHPDQLLGRRERLRHLRHAALHRLQARLHVRERRVHLVRDAGDHLPERGHLLALDQQRLLLLELRHRVLQVPRALLDAMLEELVRLAQLAVEAADDAIVRGEPPGEPRRQQEEQARVHEEIHAVTLGVGERVAEAALEGPERRVEARAGRAEVGLAEARVLGRPVGEHLARRADEALDLGAGHVGHLRGRELGDRALRALRRRRGRLRHVGEQRLVDPLGVARDARRDPRRALARIRGERIVHAPQLGERLRIGGARRRKPLDRLRLRAERVLQPDEHRRRQRIVEVVNLQREQRVEARELGRVDRRALCRAGVLEPRPDQPIVPAAVDLPQLAQGREHVGRRREVDRPRLDVEVAPAAEEQDRQGGDRRVAERPRDRRPGPDLDAHPRAFRTGRPDRPRGEAGGGELSFRIGT